jgi:hypothetical protein
MLACLAIDGRFGVVAIGRSPAEAQEFYDRVREAIENAGRNR